MNDHSAIAQARSFLFVPGNRPERFDKAMSSGADVVVLDLEDAVGLEQKDAAREAIANYLAIPRATATVILIRINATTTELGQADLAWLSRTPSIDGILLPKAESAEAIGAVATRLPALALVPIIESAKGYWCAREVAHANNVARLAFGHLDFMADTGIRTSEGEPELDPARFAIALASRDATLPAPIDGVTVGIKDAELLAADLVRSIRFGFSGKLCIHPSQVSVVHRAFAPSAEELAWAHRIVAADAAANGAAVQVDGRMVDAPVVLRARKALDLQRRLESAVR